MGGRPTSMYTDRLVYIITIKAQRPVSPLHLGDKQVFRLAGAQSQELGDSER